MGNFYLYLIQQLYSLLSLEAIKLWDSSKIYNWLFEKHVLHDICMAQQSKFLCDIKKRTFFSHYLTDRSNVTLRKAFISACFQTIPAEYLQGRLQKRPVEQCLCLVVLIRLKILHIIFYTVPSIGLLHQLLIKCSDSNEKRINFY